MVVKTKAVIEEVIEEANNVKILKLKPEQKIDFRPSQFIIIELGGVKRSYSIASSPGSGYIEIGFNLHPDGKLTPHLYKLKVGDVLDISGPYGGFVLDENLKDVVFISGGTGITPLMGMIRTAIEKGLGMNMTLVYSSRTEKDIVYKKELEGLAKAGKVNVNITLTREENPGYHNGRIDAEYLKECVPDLSKPTFYICGPGGLITATIKILEELGVPKERVKREAW